MEMCIASVVADEVVIVKCVELESPMFVDEIAQAEAAYETGIETAVLLRERPFFVKGVEINVIIRHPIGSTFHMVLKPKACVAADIRVPAQMVAAEGEVGRDWQHQVEVVVRRVKGVQIVEMAVHAV